MIRAPVAADLAALLALNNAHAAQLSLLDAEGLDRLLGAAAYAAVIGPTGAPAAFLIGFDHGTPPQGPNHAWFIAHATSFLYIDRVCVAADARGRGHGRALYAAAEAEARAMRAEALCCEVNLDPPNPASDAFHAALGFVEVGRAVLADRGRTVRYLTRHLG